MNRMIFLFLVTNYWIIGYCEAGTEPGSQATSSESNALAPPSFKTLAVNSMSVQTVVLTGPDQATIYYSTDGNDPSVPEPCGGSATDNTQIYTAPILLSETTTLKAVACKTGETNSQVSSKTYTKMQNEASYQEVTGFGSNPGALIMYRYIPSKVWENSGLVVVLHGCGMSAEAMKGGMSWNELAEKYKYYVVYGQQSQTNHVTKCFRFYDGADNEREQGEALSIKQMVDTMAGQNSIDQDRVFISGFSAGAAMTSVMLATYPDLFAKGAIMAGTPYKGMTFSNQPDNVATKMPLPVYHTIYRHLFNPNTKRYDITLEEDPFEKITPAMWGDLVRKASPGTQNYPQVMFIHGIDSDNLIEPFPDSYDGDPVMHQNNLRDHVTQWTDVHGTDQIADQVDNGFAGNPNITHRVYKKDDASVVETYEIKGLAHLIPVNPGTGPENGGYAQPSDPYYSQNVAGFYSAYWISKFFGLIGD